jgi:hypothetical protein
MTFSLAHIVSSKMGMQLIAVYGYQVNWLVMGTCGMVAVLCSNGVIKMVRKE